MLEERVRKILRDVARGRITPEEAEQQLKLAAVLSLEDFAKVDLGREFRRRVPEIVLARWKKPDEVYKIASEAASRIGRVIVAKASQEHLSKLLRLKPKFKVDIWRDSGLAVVKHKEFRVERTGGKVAVLTAGTADIPVAREAEVVAREMGCEVYSAYDVGVAGLHRLFQPLKEALRWGANVFVVVAGMEGALPSVVAGLVDVPVVGVPASTGYGYGGGGMAALMAMLQSCSLGLAVVNVDNGVGAGAYAALIALQAAK